MPAMDGIEATEKIRELKLGRPSLISLVVSANAFSEDIENAKKQRNG